MTSHVLPRLTLLAVCAAVVGFVCWTVERAPARSGPGAPADIRATPARTLASAPAFQHRIVQGGIAADIDVHLVEQEGQEPTTLRVGRDARFRVRLSDATTSEALTRVYPAMWLAKKEAPGVTDERTCFRKAETLIGGSLFTQADLDLNTYFVLTLNGMEPGTPHATIAVVDPRFGFGSTKMLTLITLPSPGEDWVVTPDQDRVFVTLPATGQVAVIDTSNWTLSHLVETGGRPTRVRLQPDGQHVWVSNPEDGAASGVFVLSLRDPAVVARIPTGPGRHEIAFTPDSRHALVTNGGARTLSVVDARALRVTRTVTTHAGPAAIAYSTLAGRFYVTHSGPGIVSVIDPGTFDVAADIRVEPGITDLEFAPGDRHALIVNPKTHRVHVIDAPSQRLVQSGAVGRRPHQISFSDDMCYIRHIDEARVVMIPLKGLGTEGQPLNTVEITGGDAAPGRGMHAGSLADSIVRAPGSNAVLVANPTDRAVYFYKEGMASPMGTFKNYGREPRAVLAVDRSLRERGTAGTYETFGRIPEPGRYDLIFFLDAPRIVQCVEFEVPQHDATRATKRKHVVELTLLAEEVHPGETVAGNVRLHAPDRTLVTGLRDVSVRILHSSGVWHRTVPAKEIRGTNPTGVYLFEFVPPTPGFYYAYCACPSLDVGYGTARADMEVTLPANTPTGPASTDPTKAPK